MCIRCIQFVSWSFTYLFIFCETPVPAGGRVYAHYIKGERDNMGKYSNVRNPAAAFVHVDNLYT